MIEEIFERIQKDTGFIGGIVSIIERKDDEIRASISPERWRVEIEIGKKTNFKNKFIKDILLHEIAHWKICPKDIVYHYHLLDIAHFYFKKEDLSFYITNAFEDLIVNTWNRFKNPPYKGQIEFFKIQISKKTSKFYIFFVLSNLLLFEDKNGIKEVFKGYDFKNKKYKGIFDDANNLVRKWNLPSDIDEKLEYISQPSKWDYLFKEFIFISLKYFKDIDIKVSLSAFAPTFNKLSKEKASVEKYINFKKGKIGKNSIIYSSFEYLDKYYEIQTPYIHVKVSHPNKMNIPYFKYGKEKFDPNFHSFTDINFRSPLFDPDSPFKNKVNFNIKPFSKDIYLKESGYFRSFPDLMIIIDSSGSMTGGKGFSWGEKYQNAVLGVYGVLHFLKRKRIAPYVKYSLISFSTHTYSTGWLSYGNLKKLKKLLLSPQRGITKLKIEVLKELERKNKNKKLILFITDSRIFNWESIKKAFIDISSKNYFFLFQIGDACGYAFKDLKDRFNYIVIKNIKDLAFKIIEVSKNVYLKH